MVPMTPSGMPGTSRREGRARNGNGTSEPRMTKGEKRASSFSRWAQKIIGGMPTPPPMSSGRGRSGWKAKGLPMGPSTLSVSPGRRSLSNRVPSPTTL